MFDRFEMQDRDHSSVCTIPTGWNGIDTNHIDRGNERKVRVSKRKQVCERATGIEERMRQAKECGRRVAAEEAMIIKMTKNKDEVERKQKRTSMRYCGLRCCCC